MKPNRHLDAGAGMPFSEPNPDLINTLPNHARIDAANSEPHLDAVQMEDLPDTSLDVGAPWQSREDLQTEADTENRAQKVRQQEQTRQELIRLQKEEALSAAGRYEANMASMRGAQEIELRRREVSLQNQIDALHPWNILQKRELGRQLAIATERLNGLTQSTPKMRQLERQKSAAHSISDAIPGRLSAQAPRKTDHRPAHIRERDHMHAAAEQRDRMGFFAKLFQPKKHRAAHGKTLGASARYGQELRKGYGETTISQQDLDDLNDQLDKVA